MKKIGLLVMFVTILVISGCPFKKLNKRFDKLEGQITQYHQEEMGAMQKNHQEAMDVINKVNKTLASNSSKLEEIEAATLQVSQLIKEGFSVTGQMLPRKSVHVRTGPSIAYQSVGYLHGGDSVKIEKIEGSWGKIKEGEWKGKWCFMRYMRLRIETSGES